MQVLWEFITVEKAIPKNKTKGIWLSYGAASYLENTETREDIINYYITKIQISRMLSSINPTFGIFKIIKFLLGQYLYVLQPNTSSVLVTVTFHARITPFHWVKAKKLNLQRHNSTILRYYHHCSWPWKPTLNSMEENLNPIIVAKSWGHVNSVHG